MMPHPLPILILAVLMATPVQANYVCVEGNCLNGKGKLMMKEGAGSMEGEFWNGNLVRGKVVTPQGDVFEGYFQDSSLSQGIKRFKNGIIMRGRFKSNILVNGMISYPNGEQYSVRLGSQKKMIQIPRELLPQRVPPPDAPSR